jgi:hypothetical protein
MESRFDFDFQFRECICLIRQLLRAFGDNFTVGACPVMMRGRFIMINLHDGLKLTIVTNGGHF